MNSPRLYKQYRVLEVLHKEEQQGVSNQFIFTLVIGIIEHKTQVCKVSCLCKQYNRAGFYKVYIHKELTLGTD